MYCCPETKSKVRPKKIRLVRSLVGQSLLLREAQLFEAGLSLIRSLVGQSSLLREAQFETGLSLIRSLMGHPPLLREAGVSDVNRPLL